MSGSSADAVAVTAISAASDVGASTAVDAAGPALEVAAFAAPAWLVRASELLSVYGPHVTRLSYILLGAATLSAIARTLHYVTQRRAGHAGPAHAVRLTKLWACAGLAHAAAVVAGLYLEPVGLGGAAAVLRALAACALAFGARLPVAVRAYDGPLREFYDARAIEIEAYLARGTVAMRDVDDAVSELARFLLDHLAVGGLSGSVRALTGLAAEAESGTDAQSASGSAKRRRPGGQLLSEAAGGVAGGGGGGGGRSHPGGGSRAFFAGSAHERADAVNEMATGLVEADAARGELRPAYEGSRAMRAQFRRRRSTMGSASSFATEVSADERAVSRR
jgi:uncharacterized membrane protein YgcG